MAVKILIGGEDSIPQLLEKQKASWEKLEQKTDDFGKSVARSERAVINHGKSLVKQHRTAEQVLKDRVAAVELAAKKEQITDEEKLVTINRIIGKYREEKEAAKRAATEGTEAFKKQAKEVEKGKQKVEQLIRVNKTLDQQYDEIRRSMKAAFDAGEVSADDYKASLRQLQAEQDKVGKKGKKAIGPEFLTMAAGAVGGILSIATAWQTAMAAVEFYNNEKDKAVEATNSLNESRRSLRQVSKGDFDALEQRADDLTKLGITREQARELVFSGRSTGFEGEEATVAKADPVINIQDGAAFAGEFRKFFGGDNLTIEQAFNTALAGAAESKFNISELLPQVRTAAQGALKGGESSDVVAATSILADKFGQSTGDRLRALGGKVALDDRTTGLNLIDAVKMLQGDEQLRKDILKDSSELQAVFAEFSAQMDRIVSADKRIEIEQKRVGDQGLIAKAINEALDPTKQSGRIEIARRESIAQEQQLAIETEKRLSETAFKTRSAVAENETAALGDPNSTPIRRFSASIATWLASNFTDDASQIAYASRFGSEASNIITSGEVSFNNEREQQANILAVEVQKKGFEVLESAAARQNELTAQQIELLGQLREELKGKGPLSRPGEDR